MNTSPRGKNRTTREAKLWAASVLDSPEYQLMFNNQIRTGTLPSNIQAMLYHYRYGKPKDTVDVNVNESAANLAELTTDQLADRADALAGAIRAGRELAALKAAEAERALAAANPAPVIPDGPSESVN